MLLKTSTITAPWTVVHGNYKWLARVETLRTLTATLKQKLG